MTAPGAPASPSGIALAAPRKEAEKPDRKRDEGREAEQTPDAHAPKLRPILGVGVGARHVATRPLHGPRKRRGGGEAGVSLDLRQYAPRLGAAVRPARRHVLSIRHPADHIPPRRPPATAERNGADGVFSAAGYAISRESNDRRGQSMSTQRLNPPLGLRMLPAFLALLFALPLLSACGVNTIPTQEEQAKAAWSEVLNQYQRRADLIPNLVETVKGYAAQEKDVLTSVVEARAKATQTQVNVNTPANPEQFKAFQEGQAGLTSALSRLLAVVENYPDLKSNQNFLALQAQLEGTENRIAVARRDYIEAVRVYNTSLRTFPTVLWAKFWYTDAKPFENFTISEDKMQTPKVDFGKKS
jgi:LemA protein